jgi:MYXO-CTERM domain-containing protein
MPDDPPRRKVDLTKLPARWQYGIALATVAVVVTVVFAVGPSHTTEGWAVPALVWLAVLVLLGLMSRRRR